MEKAIYKIENKINHKIYIGQSIHPNQRFAEHLRVIMKKPALYIKPLKNMEKRILLLKF